jgi:formamidopyrimidine-DNA glycosylase
MKEETLLVSSLIPHPFFLDAFRGAVKHKATGVVPAPADAYNPGRSPLSPADETPVPELPEVETTVREIHPEVVGRHIASVRVSGHALRRPWSPAWEPLLRGRQIADVRRRGKWIVVALASDAYLVVHLGMTGRLTVVPSHRPAEPHTHLVFGLRGTGKQLRFRDVRRFGSATLFPDRALLEQFFTDSRLGPEPFELEDRYWCEQLACTDRRLKAVLLDQRVVAGVGNIYADEALFESRLHPTRPARSLTKREARRLREAVVAVLHRAIRGRGSSVRDYVGGTGQKGEYQKEHRVYGRTGKPCVRCGTPIACIRLAGRSTHFCPTCQKAR